MRTILCYGDSNTWGYNPADGGKRHKFEDRWTTVLQKNLGDSYNVIPEGLNGRTTVWDDPLKECVNGNKYLLATLISHKPIDLVILFLGTNDLKRRFNLSASDIASGVGVLIDTIKNSGTGVNGSSPEVLVLIPPEVRKLSNFKDKFEGSDKISKKLPEYYNQMAKSKGVSCIEIGKHVRLSDLDGIHFEKSQLPIVADILTKFITNKFNNL